MTYSLRPAAAGDIDRLQELRQERSLAERTAFDASKSRSALYELLFQPQWGRAWAITTGDAIVGYVLMTVGFHVDLGGQHGFFDEMYVQQEHRGHDLGTRALAVVESACAQMGLRHLLVGVNQAGVRAQTQWRQVGFSDGPFQLMIKALPERTWP
jgi:GNAT superfamily N-acetyltransferase